jgi:hypothetical protein
MNLEDFSTFYLIIAVAIAIIMHVLFLRKHIVVLLDPWLFLFLNELMIFAVMLYSYMQHLMLPSLFFYYLASWFAFVLGLSIFYKKQIEPYKNPVLINYRTTGLALKISMVIMLLNGILIFYFLGIPLFNSARTISDYSKLGSGFGILFYVNWGIQNLVLFLALKKWLFEGNKKLGLYALIFIVIFNILNRNSRSGYLDIIMDVTLGMYYMERNFKMVYKLPKIFYIALYILPFYILYTFVSAVNEGYETNVFLAVIRRTIGTAEGPFYYFSLNSYKFFTGLNLFSYHFSQILPYFGYVDKNAINLGVNLSLQSDLAFGTPGYGPNPTMFVIGHIAWGYFGIIYCFLIGAFLSYLRYKMKVGFFVWIVLNVTAMTLVGDGTLMPLTLFYLVLLSPIFIVSYALSKKTPVPEVFNINT